MTFATAALARKLAAEGHDPSAMHARVLAAGYRITIDECEDVIAAWRGHQEAVRKAMAR